MKVLSRTAIALVALSSSWSSSFVSAHDDETHNNAPQTVLPIPGGRPEGITPGPAGSSVLYVSEILSGRVLSIDVLTGATMTIVPAQRANRQAWGLWHYRDAIFVAGGGRSFGDGPAEPQVYVYDVTTGTSIANCTPASYNENGVFLNDVTVDEDTGIAYATDSVHGKLMAFDTAATIATGNCSVWEVDLPTNFDPTGPDDFGVNGVVMYGDGLLVCHEVDGSVWYISDLDTPATPSFQELIPDGGVLGADGLTIQNDVLYITQNLENLISVYALERLEMTSNASAASSTSLIATYLGNLTSDEFATPATSAMYKNYIYSTNARFTSFPDIATPTNNTVIGVLNTFYTATDDENTASSSTSPGMMTMAKQNMPGFALAVAVAAVAWCLPLWVGL